MAGEPVDIGKLNKRITIQRIKSTATKDAAGHTDPLNPDNWETYTTVWAAIYSRGSREFQRANQTQANLQHMVEIRYSSIAALATTAMRISWSDGGIATTEQIASPPENIDGNKRLIRFGTTESK